MILAVVEDLMFLSRIQQTAKLIGVPVEVVDPRRLQERAMEAGVRAVILDLNHRSGNAVEALRALKADLSTSHLHVENDRSEEHTSELQSLAYLVCRLLLE